MDPSSATRDSSPRKASELVMSQSLSRSSKPSRRSLSAGVSFVPGALFSPSGRFGHCLRLNAGFALDDAVLARLAGVGRTMGNG